MSYNQSGITGNLVSVHLSDLMLSFEKNKQTGTLHIGPQDGGTKIYIRNGAVFGCSSELVESMPFLLHTALRRGVITAQNVNDILKIVNATGQSLRQSISRSRLLNDADVDMIASFCIEERVFPLFQMTEGYFSFNESETAAAIPTEQVVELKDTTLRISHIIMEAARRNDEWERVRAVVDSTALYIVDQDSHSAALRGFEVSNPEAGVVARYLDGKNTLYAVASKTGVGLLEIHLFVSELIQAGLARIQSPSDVVKDALALQQEGNLLQACDLLETVRIHTRIEEVLRPLAAINIDLNRTEDAVAIYSELAQENHDRGRLAEALGDVDAALALAPEDPELHYLRARVCADLGDSEGAAAGYRFVAQSMRFKHPKPTQQTTSAGTSTNIRRSGSEQYGEPDTVRQVAPSADSTPQHIHSSGVPTTRASGQYEMGNLPKNQTDPLIPAPAAASSATGSAHTGNGYDKIAALTAEHIALMFKTTSIPSRLVQSIRIQLQKVMTDEQASGVINQAMVDAKNILDFQRCIDSRLQGEINGRIIMAVINLTLIDECKNSAQAKSRSVRAEDSPSSGSASRSGSISRSDQPELIKEKDTDVVRMALINCMGPIGNVLMKRHLTNANNLEALITSLEKELPDEQTKATFRTAISKSTIE